MQQYQSIAKYINLSWKQIYSQQNHKHTINQFCWHPHSFTTLLKWFTQTSHYSFTALNSSPATPSQSNTQKHSYPNLRPFNHEFKTIYSLLYLLLRHKSQQINIKKYKYKLEQPNREHHNQIQLKTSFYALKTPYQTTQSYTFKPYKAKRARLLLQLITMNHLQLDESTELDFLPQQEQKHDSPLKGNHHATDGFNFNPQKSLESIPPIRNTALNHQTQNLQDQIQNYFITCNQGGNSKIFMACLLIFDDHTQWTVQKILTMIFDRKIDKLIDIFQQRSDTIKAYRKEYHDENNTSVQFRQELQNLLKKNGINLVKQIQQFIKVISQSRSLMTIKSIQENPNIKDQDKNTIIKLILTDKNIISSLRPQALQQVLKKKLKIIIESINPIASDPFIAQIIKTKNLSFLNNMEKYPTMYDINLNQRQKITLGRVISRIPQYKKFIQNCNKDLPLKEFQFLKEILYVTTFDAPFARCASQIEIKYSLINCLIQKPLTNIYQFSESVSKKNLDIIIRNIESILLVFKKQKNYLKPLEQKMRQQIDTLLQKLPVSKQVLEELTKYLMDGDYIKFFSSKFILPDDKDLWNRYKNLKYCTEARQKNNKDIDKMRFELRQFLLNLFGQKQLKINLQQKLISQILENGNLMSIERCQDISENLRKSLLKKIQEQKAYSQYKNANFVPMPLQQKLVIEIINQLYNLNVDRLDKNSLDDQLTFSKIKLVVEQMITCKNPKSVESLSISLSGKQKMIIVNLLNNLSQPKSKSVVHQWCYGRGVDLNWQFIGLEAEIYKICKRTNNIFCEDFESILKQIKQSSDCQYILSLESISERLKHKIIQEINDTKEYRNYREKMQKKNIASAQFKVKIFIEEQMSMTFQYQDIQLIITLITQYLEYREDLDPLNLRGSIPLKQLLADKEKRKIIDSIMDSNEVKVYSDYFLDILQDKKNRVFEEIDRQVRNSEDLLKRFNKKEQRFKEFCGILKMYKYDIPKIRNNRPDWITDLILNDVQKLPSIKKFYAIKFTQENRKDLLVNISFKRFINSKIKQINLLPDNDIDVEQELIDWNPESVINSGQLSNKQKKKIFKVIVESDEFKDCCQVVQRKVPIKVQSMPQGIRTIINFCVANQIQVRENLMKFVKNEVKVQIQKDEVMKFPLNTTLGMFKSKLNIQNDETLYTINQKDEKDKKVVESNFQSLCINNDVLRLLIQKKITVVYSKTQTQVQLRLGQNIVTQLKQKIPSLSQQQFQIFDKNNLPLTDFIVSRANNFVTVDIIRKIVVNGQQLQQKGSLCIGDLKKNLNASKIMCQQGNQYDDNDTLDTIHRSSPNLNFTYEKIDSQSQELKLIREEFKNVNAIYDEQNEDLWGVLKGQKNGDLFDASFNKIFVECDPQGFKTSSILKGYRKSKILTYLSGLPKYNRFMEIVEEKKKKN